MTYPPEHEQAIKDATWTLYKACVVPPYSARDAVEFGILRPDAVLSLRGA